MSRATNLQIAQGLSQGLQNFVQGYVQRKDQELARQRMQTKMQEDFQRINDPNTSLPEKAALMGQYNPQSAAVMMREGMRGQTEQDFWTQKLGNIADQTLSRPSAGMQSLPKETPRGMDLIRSMGTAQMPGIGVNAFESPELNVPLQTSLQEEENQQQVHVPKSPLAMLSDEDLVEGMGRLPHKAQMFKAEIERRGREKKLEKQEDVELRKVNEPYRNKILSGIPGTKKLKAQLGRIEKLSAKAEITPMKKRLSEVLGLPIGIFDSENAQELEKLANDLTGTITSEYGNRILATEFNTFLKRIPTLLNTHEGRLRIIRNMKLYADAQEAEQKAYMRSYNQQRNMGIKNPIVTQEEVLSASEPELDRIFGELNNSLIETTGTKEISRLLPEQKSGTVRMTKDGKFYDIPSDQVDVFKKMGLAPL